MSPAVTARSTTATATRPPREPRRRRRPSTGSPWLRTLLLLVIAAIYLGPMLMLSTRRSRPSPDFAKDPVGLTTHVQRRELRRGVGQGRLPALPGQFGALRGRRHDRSTSSAALPLAVAIARRYVRGWNLLYILFVIALFLPVALIPQFQLLLNLHLYNTQFGYILLFLANPIGILILVALHPDHPARARRGGGHRRLRLHPLRRRGSSCRSPSPPSRPSRSCMPSASGTSWCCPRIYLTKEAYYPMTRGLIVFTGIYGNDWPLLAAAVLMLAAPMVRAVPVPPALHHRRLHGGLAAWLTCAESNRPPLHGACPTTAMAAAPARAAISTRRVTPRVDRRRPADR